MNANELRHDEPGVRTTPRRRRVGASRRTATSRLIALVDGPGDAVRVVPAVRPPAAASGASVADPIDRMLLTTDGTVTTLLEAGTGEPIVTALIRQAGPATARALRRLGGWWADPDVRLLALAPPEPLIARQVVLRGPRRGIAYVAAEALVAPGRLPAPLARRLDDPGASLGRLLAAGAHETRRELLQIEATGAGAAGEHLGVEADHTLLRRTYAITFGGRRVAAITEWVVPGRLAATVAEASGPAQPADRDRRRQRHFLVDL